MARLAKEVGEGRWEEEGVPKGQVTSPAHMQACKDLLINHYLPLANIPELFLVDVHRLVEEFKEMVKDAPVSKEEKVEEEMKILQDPEYRRKKSRVNLELAVKKFNKKKEMVNQEEVRVVVEEFRQDLLLLNSTKHGQVMTHLLVGVDNIIKGATYQHFDQKKLMVSEKEEFVAPYFTSPSLPTLQEELDVVHSPQGALCMAHNGWVMNHDPLKNFALEGSMVYLRRELVAWGLGGQCEAQVRGEARGLPFPVELHDGVCGGGGGDVRGS